MEDALAELREVTGTRGFRLLAMGLLVALVYPAARLVWLGVLALAYFWPALEGLFEAWRTGSTLAGWRYARKRMPFAPAVVAVVVVGGGLFLLAQVDLWQTRTAFDEFRRTELAGEFSFERGHPYRGTSWGLRGPVVVDVRFQDNRIWDDPDTDGVDGITVVRHSDSVSVGRQAMAEMARRIRRSNVANLNIGDVDAVSGATYSSLALREAVVEAIWNEKATRRLNPVSRAVLWAVGTDLSRFVFSASAVVFIIGLLFEFCLGPFLRREAGVTLPCYNCQTCVGVCPIKMVEGVPYPMTMILETRVGNYERAAELAHYCVGCSRCASRCPVGLSGALVASRALQLARAAAEAKKSEVTGD